MKNTFNRLLTAAALIKQAEFELELFDYEIKYDIAIAHRAKLKEMRDNLRKLNSILDKTT